MYGNVNANLILWIQSFVTNRRHYVHFNGTLSDVIEINTGVPQGCVLSAILLSHTLPIAEVYLNMLLLNMQMIP